MGGGYCVVLGFNECDGVGDYETIIMIKFSVILYDILYTVVCLSVTTRLLSQRDQQSRARKLVTQKRFKT